MYQAADPYEVSDFEEGCREGPDETLQLALHSQAKNLCWNCIITLKLAQSIQNARSTDPQKWSLPDVMEKYILTLVINQVSEAQRAYLLAEAKIIKGEDSKIRHETEDEVQACIHSYYHGSQDNPGRWKKVEG
ncbi:hypothetical protein GYMLUDRAFT_62537 [Collybiopsis luxurians FD-317 M1]|uniref:Uncharacterized protein n=1 Tax=Collybiopsis luxurians FD-317 M1 TaxID=944289 RepID=A0A0D0AXQ3_9AGAR|nr:hypothetical protein GYMLUDRAFT_62537 [Collybiopsis luxurians FD-317 M1]